MRVLVLERIEHEQDHWWASYERQTNCPLPGVKCHKVTDFERVKAHSSSCRSSCSLTLLLTVLLNVVGTRGSRGEPADVAEQKCLPFEWIPIYIQSQTRLWASAHSRIPTCSMHCVLWASGGSAGAYFSLAQGHVVPCNQSVCMCVCVCVCARAQQ